MELGGSDDMSVNNDVRIIGNISTDIFPRQLDNGMNICWFKVATDRRSKNGGTDFIPVKCWNGLADTVVQYMSKGKLVAVTGELRSNRRDNGDGSFTDYYEVSANEVKFLSPRDGQTDQPEAASTDTPEPAAEAVSDDDIPF